MFEHEGDALIPISRPALSSVERDLLMDAFDSGWVSSLGKYVGLAEEALCAETGMPYAAVVSSGTSALHLALLALGVGPADEVIIPSSTYVATLNAVLYVGARPIIVDVDVRTWCIDVSAVALAVTPATAAVIAVDLYGHPADYNALRKLLGNQNIALIADAAESIGGRLNGEPVGSLADVTCFSFFGNKTITSGEGGAVVTRSSTYNERVRQLRNQGNHPERRYHHEVMGYNYRMTNPAAAILTGQLRRLPELLARRREVCSHYDELLSASTHLGVQSRSATVAVSPWLYTVRLLGLSAAERDRIVVMMSDRGIETRPVFPPVQSAPYASQLVRQSTPVADRLGAEGISLPTYPDLSRIEVERVSATLQLVLEIVK